MFSYTPTLDAEKAAALLEELFNNNINPKLFYIAIRNLDVRFNSYSSTFPASLIAPGLIVTPEIRQQSEIYLPVAEISRAFNRFYRQALRHPPILSSTPFHNAMSWADVFISLPPDFQFSANPARLLITLLSDLKLMKEFLFHSFLPKRFYGGFGRYPKQMEFVREWLGNRKRAGIARLRCLDAGCGTGEDTYSLAKLCMEAGFGAEETRIEGWTLEPLEVWAATHQCFSHDKQRELAFRKETSQLFERGFQSSLTFRCADITDTDFASHQPSGESAGNAKFDLILCNGLLGGPIINKPEQLERVVANLVSLLAPGGVLLAADSFHGGWKSKCGTYDLKTVLLNRGLQDLDVSDGIGGLKL